MKIQELKEALNKLHSLPKISFGHWVVFDPEMFINHSFKVLEANPGNKSYLPMYNRLIKYYARAKNHSGNVSD